MQESTTLADGSRLRPDAVVMLPDEKFLIIDSKVSLVHYERMTASTDGSERDRFLKQHVESMRAHAKGLGGEELHEIVRGEQRGLRFHVRSTGARISSRPSRASRDLSGSV